MRKFLFILVGMLALSCLACEEATNTDPCDSTYCAHGGTCIDGACDCPEQFTGPNCEELREAIAVRFTGVEIVSYPINRPNGSGWDNGNLPDLAIRLYVNDNYLQKSGYAPNTPFNTFFPLNNSHYSYDVEDQVRVEVIDIDPNNTYEVVGDDTFEPSEWGPLYYFIELYDPTSDHKIRMKVFVEWEF